MKLLITTVGGERQERRDVLVHAAADVPVRRLAPQLLSSYEGMLPPTADGSGGPVTLYLNDQPLDPGTTLASAGIRDGSTLGIGMPVPSAGSAYGPARHEMPTPSDPGGAAEVEMQVIGGPQAGRVELLGMGTHLIGPAPGSSVRLGGRGVPEDGVGITVRPDGTVIAALPEDGPAGAVLAARGAAGPSPRRCRGAAARAAGGPPGERGRAGTRHAPGRLGTVATGR